MKKSISSFLWQNLLYTLLVSGCLTLLACGMFHSKKAAGFEEKQGDFIETIAYVFLNVALTASASTVFLNINTQVRNNRFLGFLSFFLIPLLLILGIVFLDRQSTDSSLLYTVTAIFIATNAFFYLRFITQDTFFEKKNKGRNIESKSTQTAK